MWILRIDRLSIYSKTKPSYFYLPVFNYVNIEAGLRYIFNVCGVCANFTNTGELSTRYNTPHRVSFCSPSGAKQFTATLELPAVEIKLQIVLWPRYIEFSPGFSSHNKFKAHIRLSPKKVGRHYGTSLPTGLTCLFRRRLVSLKFLFLFTYCSSLTSSYYVLNYYMYS